MLNHLFRRSTLRLWHIILQASPMLGCCRRIYFSFGRPSQVWRVCISFRLFPSFPFSLNRCCVVLHVNAVATIHTLLRIQLIACVWQRNVTRQQHKVESKLVQTKYETTDLFSITKSKSSSGRTNITTQRRRRFVEVDISIENGVTEIEFFLLKWESGLWTPIWKFSRIFSAVASQR